MTAPVTLALVAAAFAVVAVWLASVDDPDGTVHALFAAPAFLVSGLAAVVAAVEARRRRASR